MTGSHTSVRSNEAERVPGGPLGEAACIACGCTEDAACPGGCSWVPNNVAEDICSSCVEFLHERRNETADHLIERCFPLIEAP